MEALTAKVRLINEEEEEEERDLINDLKNALHVAGGVYT
jgi:hypothetical protein